jgi:hypothetical protein
LQPSSTRRIVLHPFDFLPFDRRVPASHQAACEQMKQVMLPDVVVTQKMNQKGDDLIINLLQEETS